MEPTSSKQDVTLKLCQTSKRAAGMDYAAVLTDILAPNYRGILKQSLKHSAVGLGQMLSFSLNNIEGDRVFLKGSRFLTLKLCLAPSSGILGAFLHADNFSQREAIPSKEGQMFFPPTASLSDLESNS